MLITFIHSTLFSFVCAVIAYVYSEVLVSGGEVLNALYKFMSKRIGKYPLLFKAVIDCSKCVCGQLVLWMYPIYMILYKGFSYDPFMHLYSIACGILIVIILLKLKIWPI